MSKIFHKILLLPKVFYLFTKATFKQFILKYCMFSVILFPFNDRIIRPFLWRLLGCKIGKNVYIGYLVYLDVGKAHLITIEDNVQITNRCLLLCHTRNMSDYFVGDDYTKLPYRHGEICLKQGSTIGMGTIVMPGVTIGRGSITGAGSVVTKSIPDWCVAAGNPAKVIRKLAERDNQK